jgi:hypothetical protein
VHRTQAVFAHDGEENAMHRAIRRGLAVAGGAGVAMVLTAATASAANTVNVSANGGSGTAISAVDPPTDEVAPTAPQPPADKEPISKQPDPSAVDPGVAPAATAPVCFTLAQWDEAVVTGWKSHARSRNECSTTYRVRFIWAWATDGPCTSVPPNWVLTSWRWNKAPYVSEIRSC